MNIFDLFTDRVIAATKTIVIPGVDWDDIDFLKVVVEPPRDSSHGDLATNMALVLAKPVGVKPRDLAEKVVPVLLDDENIETATLAGPGFINIVLHADFWRRHLRIILDAGERYGANYVKKAHRVNVEYVSANPTGPMHVGHCRGAVVGDVLANLLEFAGHSVTKEYYINDAGSQIDTLARSAYLRYREALGDDIGAIPEGLYPGDYLIAVGQQLTSDFGEKLKNQEEAEWMPVVRAVCIAAMMDLIRNDLGQLNVHHDVFFSEKTLHEQTPDASSLIEETLVALEARDLVYVGTLPPPKGQLPEDWEDRPQTLLKATDFGDDIDRPLKKSDGTFTYFAADVAYFRDKYERGFDDMIYVLGADHAGYVKRLGAVARAIAGDDASLHVVLCQLVKLLRAGEPVKMSKRSGNLITLRDVVEEVGSDVVRFMMLYRKSDAPLDFDFERVVEQSKENPVFYVQYAYARTHSVFDMAENRTDLTEDDWKNAPIEIINRLNDPSEITLIQKMAAFPRFVRTATESREPHRIAFYLYDLASAFHSHWNYGKERADLRFINEDDRESTMARLALVYGVNRVIKAGLDILGVSAPKEMR